MQVTEQKTTALLLSSLLPQSVRRLPIIDVGAHDATDYTIPAASLGHRVYCFEPTPDKYNQIVESLSKQKILHVNTFKHFSKKPPGTVFLQQELAVSNERGRDKFLVSTIHGGVGNSLKAQAVPKWIRDQSKYVEVELLPLDYVLAAAGEQDGVYMLKIDAQGHEFHILNGTRHYITSSKVYVIHLEYCANCFEPQGITGIQILEFLHWHGYKCYDARAENELGVSFEAFIDKYKRTSSGWGKFTDLTCLRRDLF